ncbi:uncharacterized protein C11orf24-like [Heterodontus francisci]|uniref:uncharacterized protein C11orf24-like n=1 Tax=Heterodontus francisci TaxID=7792 RepID=UPI00355C2386
MWTPLGLFLYISISSLTESSMYNLQNNGIKVLKSLHVSGAEECKLTCDDVSDQDGLECNWVVIEEKQNLCFYLHCLDIPICKGVNVEDVKTLQIGQSLPIKIFLSHVRRNRRTNKSIREIASVNISRSTSEETTLASPPITTAPVLSSELVGNRGLSTTTVSPAVTHPTTTTTSRKVTTTTVAPTTMSRKVTTTTVAPTTMSRKVTTTTVAPTTMSRKVTTTTAAPTTVSRKVTTTTAAPTTVSQEVTSTTMNKTTVAPVATTTRTTVNVTVAASSISDATPAITAAITTAPATNNSAISATEPTSLVLTSSTEYTTQLPTTSLAETTTILESNVPLSTGQQTTPAPTTVYQTIMENETSIIPNSNSTESTAFPQSIPSTTKQAGSLKTAAPSSSPKLTNKTLMLTVTPIIQSTTQLIQESTTLQKQRYTTKVNSSTPGTIPTSIMAGRASKPPEIKPRTTLAFNDGKNYVFPSVPAGSLIKYLADTSSLIAVLIFGLLFFLVSVILFAQKAFESYRRKDYVQVDYLINGMYADSDM